LTILFGPLKQIAADQIPSNIGRINQNEFKEEYAKPPLEANEDVKKTVYGDASKRKS